MHKQPVRLRVFVIVAGIAALAFGGWASADPPSRIARLGYMTGAVSFSPAGENEWVQATINRPLTTGDRLWSDAGSRAEIQVGGAMIRMGAGTGVSILNLNDRIAQLQLTQGTLNVRVRSLARNQLLEVDTPNLAFTLRQPGEYRISVDADGGATDIVVRKGQGEVYGEGASYVVDSRQPYRFTGTGLRDYQYVDAPRLDEFDTWSTGRDRSYDNSPSARYVSRDVVGYQDLDANGSWRVDASYGNVWVPNRVAAGWAPYRDGHWAWVDPWGWTWVDDAPWGFAVSHYGRWANMGGTWGWVPGPVSSRAYYAPALVAFVGGNNFQLTISGGNVGGIAWFPLGPREVYRPSYTVSRGYFENVNRSNTVINTTVINNYYNNTNVTNVVYANREVPGAVIAVPTTVFVQSQQVSRSAVRVTREMVASAPVALIPSVAPTETSVRGATGAGGKPPARVFERPVVARTAPPAAHAGFAAQQQQLAAKPGKPLDEAARKELKPATTAQAPVVNVVAQPQSAAPTARPPATTTAAKPSDARRRLDEPKAPAAPVTSDTSAPRSTPSQATVPASAAPPPEQRGKPERGDRNEQRPPTAVPPPAPPRVAAPAPATTPQVVPPQVVPPTATAPPPEQRGKPEPNVKGPERAQSAPPPQKPAQIAAPAPAAPPQVVPPQVVPPSAAAPPQDQRGKPEQRGKGEQRPPAASTPPVPNAVPAAQPPPKAEPAGKEPKPASGKPSDRKKDRDEQKRDDEERKQKN